MPSWRRRHSGGSSTLSGLACRPTSFSSSTRRLEDDRWNVDGVKEGYLSLAAENPDVAMMISSSDVDSTGDLIISTLRDRGVLLGSA